MLLTAWPIEEKNSRAVMYLTSAFFLTSDASATFACASLSCEIMRSMASLCSSCSLSLSSCSVAMRCFSSSAVASCDCAFARSDSSWVPVAAVDRQQWGGCGVPVCNNTALVRT